MENIKQEYQVIYSYFIKGYNSGDVFSGEQIGFIIVLLANAYVEKNLILGVKEAELRKVALSNINIVEANGKSISAAKAGIVTDASLEASEYRRVEIARDNIDKMIYAIRSLQGGMVKEYKNS